MAYPYEQIRQMPEEEYREFQNNFLGAMYSDTWLKLRGLDVSDPISVEVQLYRERYEPGFFKKHILDAPAQVRA